ncbi:MAG: ATP-binding protein [Candidatus Cloacimonadaceae bacterium]|nr:ATP-binding protein [Candidatus Cloacimonadota bacterium]MCK9242035.1 ATP-binding protein [Candidatus Cloacimonadota bacterium]
MYPRVMQGTMMKVAKGFPIITITGPRQSGKTTLARMQFPDYQYIDLENPELRFVLESDPKSLLSDADGRYIIDEFQYAPGILPYIKMMADSNPIPARFILTGSNQFSKMRQLSQSLAGRTAIFQLLPFSYPEIYQDCRADLNELLFKGFYPRLIAQNMGPQMFYTSYINTYLERDVPELTQVQDRDLFFKFLGLCAGRTASILNKTALANETGVDVKTVSNWLSILQTSYIIHLLQPWHKNQNKRLVKSPKLYFLDTGLACRLLRIRDARDLVNHPLKGQLFETFVVSEYLKMFYNQGSDAPLYFYRENSGLELDLLIQSGAKLMPVEIKSARVFNPSFIKNIKVIGKSLGFQSAKIIYGGDLKFTKEEIDICPYHQIPVYK